MEKTLTPMERTQLAEELSGLLGEPTTTLLRTALSDTALRAIHARMMNREKTIKNSGTQENWKPEIRHAHPS